MAQRIKALTMIQMMKITNNNFHKNNNFNLINKIEQSRLENRKKMEEIQYAIRHNYRVYCINLISLMKITNIYQTMRTNNNKTTNKINQLIKLLR